MKALNKVFLLCSFTALLGFAGITQAQDAPAEPAPALTPAPAPAPVEGNWDDDWKITMDGTTDNGGTLSFTVRFEPNDDGTARPTVTVDVPIPEDTGENDMADMVGNAFKATLGEDDFDIDVSWGEHVKVETDGDTPDFELTIANNPLQGISVEIKD